MENDVSNFIIRLSAKGTDEVTVVAVFLAIPHLKKKYFTKVHTKEDKSHA